MSQQSLKWGAFHLSLRGYILHQKFGLLKEVLSRQG